jgi:hypothetical protein
MPTDILVLKSRGRYSQVEGNGKLWFSGPKEMLDEFIPTSVSFINQPLEQPPSGPNTLILNQQSMLKLDRGSENGFPE